MKKTLLLAAMVVASAMSQATVVKFNDISGQYDGAPVPASYDGLTWAPGMYVYSNGTYDSTYGNTYGSDSGWFAYNGFGNVSEMVSADPIYFNGANFSTWAYFDSPASFSSSTVTLTGYLGLTQVGTVTASLSSNSFNWVGAGWTVDSVVITNDGSSGRWWLMDDLTYNASTTPAPLAAIPFALGLLRRRKRA